MYKYIYIYIYMCMHIYIVYCTHKHVIQASAIREKSEAGEANGSRPIQRNQRTSLVALRLKLKGETWQVRFGYQLVFSSDINGIFMGYIMGHIMGYI